MKQKQERESYDKNNGREVTIGTGKEMESEETEKEEQFRDDG